MTGLPEIALLLASLLLGGSAIVYRRRTEPEEPLDQFFAWILGTFFLAIVILFGLFGLALLLQWMMGAFGTR